MGIFQSEYSIGKRNPIIHLAQGVLKRAVLDARDEIDLYAIDWLKDENAGMFFAEVAGFDPLILKRWAWDIDERDA